MKERHLNILKLVISFIIFLFLSVLISAIFSIWGLNVSTFDYRDYGYFNCLVEIILLLVVYLLYRKSIKMDAIHLKKRFNRYINDILKYVVIFFTVKIASALITNIISYLLGTEFGDSENQNLIIKITKAAPFLMLISTSILAPIVEEGVFRLAFRKVFKNDYIYILISGFVFGFMHIFPTDLALSLALINSITYVAMGIYLAYVYVKTDNIWTTIVLHAINNLLSMLAIIFIMN